MEFESIEVLFNQLNLDHIKNMLMSAYHSSGAGRPPFDPLGLLRFKIMYFMKGYRSQRALEREIRVDGRARELCGFEEKPPSHSTIVRFENNRCREAEETRWTSHRRPRRMRLHKGPEGRTRLQAAGGQV
jgi:transposase